VYVTNTPKQPPPRKQHLTHRLVTPQLIEAEYRALEACEPTPDDFRRVANRLNVWIAASSGDDADLQPLE
jgi:hypothetical protein